MKLATGRVAFLPFGSMDMPFPVQPMSFEDELIWNSIKQKKTSIMRKSTVLRINSSHELEIFEAIEF